MIPHSVSPLALSCATTAATGRRSAAKLLSKDEARRIAQRREADAYGSNCNVKLTALHRLKPSSNAKSHEGSITAWLRS